MSSLSRQVAGSTEAGLDVERIREDFPVLKQKIHGKPLVYLDNAATSQKPKSVIEAITKVKGLGSIPIGGFMGFMFAEYVWLDG